MRAKGKYLSAEVTDLIAARCEATDAYIALTSSPIARRSSGKAQPSRPAASTSVDTIRHLPFVAGTCRLRTK